MSVTLTVAGFLCALGFGVFVIGAIFRYRGVAVIGAVLIVGVGAMFTATGLSYASGKTVETIDNNTTRHITDYQPVDLPTRLPFGFLVMLTGGVLVLRGFGLEMQ